jgi:hypothetical protein
LSIRSATRRTARKTGGKGLASLRLRISAFGVSIISRLSSFHIGIDRIDTPSPSASQRRGGAASARKPRSLK